MALLLTKDFTVFCIYIYIIIISMSLIAFFFVICRMISKAHQFKFPVKNTLGGNYVHHYTTKIGTKEII